MLCHLKGQTLRRIRRHTRSMPTIYTSCHRVGQLGSTGEHTDRLACDRMFVVERWPACLDSHTSVRHRESSKYVSLLIGGELS